MPSPSQSLTRRRIFAAPLLFSGLHALHEKGKAATVAGYGELQPAGEMLTLPRGFQYSILSYEGDMMADGFPVPSAMDGHGLFCLTQRQRPARPES